MKKGLSDSTYSVSGNIFLSILIVLISTVALICWEIHVSGKITGLEFIFMIYMSSYDLLINSATKNNYIRIATKSAVLLGLFLFIVLLYAQNILIYSIIAFNGIVLIFSTLKSQNSLLKRFIFSFVGALLPITSVLYLDYYANLYELWLDLPLLLFGIWAIFFALTKIKQFFLPYILLVIGIPGITYLMSTERYKSALFFSWDAFMFLKILLIMFIGFMLTSFFIYGKNKMELNEQREKELEKQYEEQFTEQNETEIQ